MNNTPHKRYFSFIPPKENRARRLLIGIMTLSLIFCESFSNRLASATINSHILPQSILLPTPPTLVPSLKGLRINPEYPLEMEFIVDASEQYDFKTAEARKLINYFLAALTIPSDELWVNLSPYEEYRVISENLSRTDIGRDLLAQDYVLKKFAASLTHPHYPLGKNFWERLRREAFNQYGVVDVPLDTFTKVWIVPERATLYEADGMVYIDDSYLKVMLQDDYEALRASRDGQGRAAQSDLTTHQKVNELSKEISREILIPVIEKEVNEGAHFAPLRQIYHSMILAIWYKENLGQNIVVQLYADKSKTAGIEQMEVGINQEVYQKYLDVFKRGVFNFISEDYDPATNAVTPRQYYSGGMNFDVEEKKFSSSPVPSQWLQGKIMGLISPLLLSITLIALSEPNEAVTLSLDDGQPTVTVVQSQQEEAPVGGIDLDMSFDDISVLENLHGTSFNGLIDISNTVPINIGNFQGFQFKVLDLRPFLNI